MSKIKIFWNDYVKAMRGDLEFHKKHWLGELVISVIFSSIYGVFTYRKIKRLNDNNNDTEN